MDRTPMPNTGTTPERATKTMQHSSDRPEPHVPSDPVPRSNGRATVSNNQRPAPVLDPAARWTVDPDTAAFADDALERLWQRHGRAARRGAEDAEPRAEAAPSEQDDDAIHWTPLEDLDPPARGKGRAPARRSTDHVPPVPPVPPVGDLVLTLRLAATFGTGAALRARLRRRAVTVLRLPDSGDPARAAKLMTRALLPEGLHSDASPDTAGWADLLLIPVTEAKNWTAVTAALDTDRPLIVLVPDGLPRPASLTGLPKAEGLAPLTGAMLLRLLRRTHIRPEAFDTTPLQARMPGDAALARLAPTALALAFRGESAFAVVARLETACQPPPSGPPITGQGPAEDAARALLAGWTAWRDGTVPWSDLPRSLLISGPPGTGKTWLARAMARHLRVPLVQTGHADWQATGHLGDMLAAMRASFAAARRQAPCMLFLDEIDAFGSRTGSDRHAATYRMQVIAGLLGEIDALAQVPGVLLIGACNHPDRLDPAITRPGRFDRAVEMGPPGLSDVRAMLATGVGDTLPPEEIDDLARRALGRTRADLDAGIRAAKSVAREQSRGVTARDLAAALTLAPATPTRARVEHRIALHECGHALVAHALGCGPVLRVALLPDGGEMVLAPDGPLTRDPVWEDGCADLAILLAGRAAERVGFGVLSMGAGGAEGSDLARATERAVEMHLRSGLGRSGVLWRGEPSAHALRDPDLRRAVNALLHDAEARATAMLTALRPRLVKMAGDLVRERQLEGDALQRWFVGMEGEAGSWVEGHDDGHRDPGTAVPEAVTEIDAPVTAPSARSGMTSAAPATTSGPRTPKSIPDGPTGMTSDPVSAPEGVDPTASPKALTPSSDPKPPAPAPRPNRRWYS